MKKILVIEDDEDTGLILSWFLESENFMPIVANNGITGLELAKKAQPDLILSDVNMPGMNGYDVLKALREDAITANIPFIFLTSELEPDDRSYALRLGADDYLAKPVDLSEVMAAIVTQLNRIFYQNPEKNLMIV
jgi:DNA-binding response OmpR family regulator